jgi:hypothetical protein
MILKDNKEEADLYYLKQFFCIDDSELAEWGFNLAKDEHMGEVILHVPDDFQAQERLPAMMTDPPNFHSKSTCRLLVDWDKEVENRDGDYIEEDLKELEYVPKGGYPQVMTNGWAWPRWDDDAMSFCLVTPSLKPAEAGI